MKPTITIGIPAYNEAKNIKSLIESILRQQNDLYSLKSIIVSSDGSTDQTISIVRSLNNAKIKILANRSRRGIARGLNQIITQSKTDILVTLDADITIQSNDFIDDLVKPIIDGRADLTSSAIKHLNGTTPTSQALQIGMQVKQILFTCLGNPNNIYHCYGLARAYSRRLYSDMVIPVSVGNDMYTYLYCLSHNYRFQYVENATAWYKIPTNFKDHISQSRRFTMSGPTMGSLFGVDFVNKQLIIPKLAFIHATLLSLPIVIMHPISVIRYLIIQIIARIMKHEDVKEAWTVAESSK